METLREKHFSIYFTLKTGILVSWKNWAVVPVPLRRLHAAEWKTFAHLLVPGVDSSLTPRPRSFWWFQFKTIQILSFSEICLIFQWRGLTPAISPASTASAPETYMEINLVYNYDIDATRNSSCCCVCCHCWHCSSSSSAFLISLPVCPRWRLVLMSVCLGRFSDTSSLPDFEMDGFGANHDTLHTCCRFYSCLARCILISLVLMWLL